MLRLALKLVLAGAFLFAVWTWVPVGGRTLDARWRAASGPSDFARRTIADLGPGGGAGESRAAPGAQGRNAPRDRRDERRERMSDADRQALDRRLAEELKRDGSSP